MRDMDGAEAQAEKDWAEYVESVRAKLDDAWTNPTNGVTREHIEEAHELLQTDWDAQGSVPVYLPRVAALRLFEQTGGRIERRTASSFKRGPQEYDLYINAHDTGSDFELEAAVTTALVALSFVNDGVPS